VGLKILGNRSLAEELVQEVFLKVWRSAGTFDSSRGSFSTWLYRVSRSCALDLFRKRASRVRPQPSGNQQVELKLNNFEEPKLNSYYELWFVSGERRISAGSFTSVGEGETRVLLNVAPEARNYRTLLITEEHVDERSTSGEEVALKGKVP
jgi:RNA polymerase sigma factor (sigma-70 family)